MPLVKEGRKKKSVSLWFDGGRRSVDLKINFTGFSHLSKILETKDMLFHFEQEVNTSGRSAHFGESQQRKRNYLCGSSVCDSRANR